MLTPRCGSHLLFLTVSVLSFYLFTSGISSSRVSSAFIVPQCSQTSPFFSPFHCHRFRALDLATASEKASCRISWVGWSYLCKEDTHTHIKMQGALPGEKQQLS